MRELLKRLLDERGQAIAAMRAVIDEADTAKRDLSAEDNTKIDAAQASIADLDKRIAATKKLVEDEKLADEARNLLPADPRPAPGLDERGDQMTELEKRVRSFLNGESRSLSIMPAQRRSWTERRTLSRTTAAAGDNTVKVDFYDQLIAHLIEVSGILQAGPTVLTTTSGEKIQVPKTTAHGSAGIVATGQPIPANDPTFGQVTLDAYKYAVLIQVAKELVTDTSVDLLAYLAMQAGRAIGNAFGTHAILGTGAGAQPVGLLTQTTLGKTGGAGVGGAFTADDLIDLFFSVIAPYRNSKSCGWLMRDATLASVRKLKASGTGEYLWVPSYAVDVPDTILGKPVHTDPNVAAVATGAKSVAFGDISQYFVREVNGLEFERSDEFAFGSDLVTFRAKWRADGALVDTTGAVKHFIGNAA